MVCTHLRELYQLCEAHQLRLSGSDLIRVVCRQCEEEETCLSVLMEEYDTRLSQKPQNSDKTSASDLAEESRPPS